MNEKVVFGKDPFVVICITNSKDFDTTTVLKAMQVGNSTVVLKSQTMSYSCSNGLVISESITTLHDCCISERNDMFEGIIREIVKY